MSVRQIHPRRSRKKSAHGNFRQRCNSYPLRRQQTLRSASPLLPTTATQISRYLVYQTGNPNATLDVKSATLQPGNTQVRLVVTGMSYVPYTVVASGVSDASCFRNTTSQTSTQLRFTPHTAADPAYPRRVALVVTDAATGRPLQALSLGC